MSLLVAPILCSAKRNTRRKRNMPPSPSFTSSYSVLVPPSLCGGHVETTLFTAVWRISEKLAFSRFSSKQNRERERAGGGGPYTMMNHPVECQVTVEVLNVTRTIFFGAQGKRQSDCVTARSAKRIQRNRRKRFQIASSVIYFAGEWWA